MIKNLKIKFSLQEFKLDQLFAALPRAPNKVNKNKNKVIIS